MGLMDDTLPLGTRRLPDEAVFDLDEDRFDELDAMDDDQAADEDAIGREFASME